ncbi:MAG TPA: DUF1345 domain-containing protein [Polyangiaceae bacterium]|nr:DUF1345 domain-containing protein [Polyangiaceae bacterium]
MPRRPRVDPRSALVRVGISALVAAVAYVLTAPRLPPPAPALVAWCAGSLALLGLSWSAIATADAAITRARAGEEDPGRTLVYVIVLLASGVSLLAATAVVRDAHSLGPRIEHLVTALCLGTVALAWAMTHTAFAFRYARLYYRTDAEGVGGIELPEKEPPSYFDFAYFAFTIGMCFQVSDVCVTSRQIRRAVLLHAVISFAYNSVILAFVLNLVFALAA